MKIHNIMAVLGVAATTMAFTLALAVSGQVDAVDQQQDAATRITPLIGQPTLKIAGLEIKLALDKPDYAPGDKPIITLETTNPTDERIETSAWIGMTSTGLASRMSRALTMPNYLWSENIPLALEPGETKKLTFTTEKELVAGNTVSVTMGDTDQKAAIAKLLKRQPAPNRAPIAKQVAAIANGSDAAVESVATKIDGR